MSGERTETVEHSEQALSRVSNHAQLAGCGYPSSTDRHALRAKGRAFADRGLSTTVPEVLWPWWGVTRHQPLLLEDWNTCARSKSTARNAGADLRACAVAAAVP